MGNSGTTAMVHRWGQLAARSFRAAATKLSASGRLFRSNRRRLAVAAALCGLAGALSVAPAGEPLGVRTSSALLRPKTTATPVGARTDGLPSESATDSDVRTRPASAREEFSTEAEPALEPPSTRQGSLVIIGGSERFKHREFWDETVRLAGGPGSRIAVFPTATSEPVRKGGWIIEALKGAGAEPFLVPLAWKGLDEDPLDIAYDANWVERVHRADGVFFVGGDQGRIVGALREDDGTPTPMLQAVWNVYQQGGVIAGTSAGAAIMSRVMYRHAESVLATLLHGVQMGEELDYGLGFLDQRWFVDQHCLVRGRFARAIVAMHEQQIPFGLGIDENTALVVEGGSQAHVIGYKGVLVLDLREAERNPRLDRFNLQKIRLSYLDRGDQIDLDTLEVTPAKEKLEDQHLEPHSPTFRPASNQRLFFTDVLGNTTVADLMGRLMDNAHDEAVGLAFDGAAARLGAVDGFEFRFSRDAASRAWYTESFGGDDYTVLNLRLDIRPIRIPGPFYELAAPTEAVPVSDESPRE